MHEQWSWRLLLTEGNLQLPVALEMSLLFLQVAMFPDSLDALEKYLCKKKFCSSSASVLTCFLAVLLCCSAHLHHTSCINWELTTQPISSLFSPTILNNHRRSDFWERHWSPCQRRRHLWRWPEDWNTSPMKTDWENWGFSDWRREGLREALSSLPVPKESLLESWRGTF